MIIGNYFSLKYHQQGATVRLQINILKTMAAITIRNVSEKLVCQRSEVIERIRRRNETLPLEKESHVQSWIEASRDHVILLT